MRSPGRQLQPPPALELPDEAGADEAGAFGADAVSAPVIFVPEGAASHHLAPNPLLLWPLVCPGPESPAK
jgi:hypothetical protein